MRPHFYRYPAPPHPAKLLVHRFLGRTDASFRHRLAPSSQHAIPAGLVSQVHADRIRPCLSSCCPFRTLCCGVILFHGRSPFALRVRYWELIASRRGIGPLIPSLLRSAAVSTRVFSAAPARRRPSTPENHAQTGRRS